MASNQQPTTKTILHVRAICTFDGRETQVGACVENRLRQAGLEVELCTDVYRALARLGKAGVFRCGDDRPFVAAIICVDHLAETEYEFFTILANHSRHLPVYVYTNAGHDEQTAAAISAGATGLLNADTIARMVTDDVIETASTASEPESESEPRDCKAEGPTLLTQPAPCDPQSAPSTAGAPTLTAYHDQADEVAPDSLDAEESESEPASSIQVPWKTHRKMPTRRPPDGVPDDTSAIASSSTESPAPAPLNSADGPLLTEEELRALLDEDVASWPPVDRVEPDAAGPNSGAKQS